MTPEHIRRYAKSLIELRPQDKTFLEEVISLTYKHEDAVADLEHELSKSVDTWELTSQ